MSNFYAQATTRKKPDLFMFCGRFQTFQVGHESVVETGFRFADRGIILVGSSQEAGTERNPFDISTRIEMIQEVYCEEVATGRLIVKPLADLTHEDDITPDWGRYVLENVKRYAHKIPEVMVYGNDEARSRWFDPEDIKDTTEIIVPRARIPVSGTEMREYMLINDRDSWNERVNPRLHKYYDRLRSELLEVEYYKNRLNELISGK